MFIFRAIRKYFFIFFNYITDECNAYRIGKGLRTEKKDDCYPGAGTYKNLPTDFPWTNIDRAKKEKEYQ